MTDKKYFFDDFGLYSFEIGYDEYADSPRDMCDTLGVMCVWWGNDCLGDYEEVRGYTAPEYLENLIDEHSPNADYVRGVGITAPLMEILDGIEDIVYKYIYVYEHSGYRMSTGSFGDPWDSGCAGIIWTDKKRFKWLCGECDDGWKERAGEILEGEVKYYDCWLRGDVYYAKTEKYDLDDEEFYDDECYGGYITDSWGDDLFYEIRTDFTSSEKFYDDFDEALRDYRNWLLMNGKWYEAVKIAS